MTLTKSIFSGLQLKCYTITTEAQDNGIKIVQDMVSGDGKAVHRRRTGKNDGKDYPIAGDPTVDTNSLTKLTRIRSNIYLRKMGKKSTADNRLSPRTERQVRMPGAERMQTERLSHTACLEKQ
jgi:hypothetical protein